MEDNFSTGGAGGMVRAVILSNGSGGNESYDGEKQMKLRSLARRSPPALWWGGVGDPCYRES